MPEWKKAGKLVLSTINFVKDNLDKDIPQVLIDLRPLEEAIKGHIPGAVSVPADRIVTMKDKFPADKKAPIILYSTDTGSSIEAFSIVRAWGYTNATVLKDGIEAWKKAGYSISQGKPAEVIVYVPKPRPGEILIEEFKQIAETLPPDKFILDVRDEDEAMHGMLRGAKNIPTQEIPERLSEIPKDKEIITHCVTGVRAEMAYHILKEAGYKVRFLNANIKIDKDGKYEISKE
ncbi:MAG: rhodanese-like domain-containing protein [Thermodesulfovibrionales bacterium]|nr:rhodanese-like domain-containing protein [Thermodesulfovibrionales bacterium]